MGTVGELGIKVSLYWILTVVTVFFLGGGQYWTCFVAVVAQDLLKKVSSRSASGAEVPTPNSQDLHECPGVVEDHDLGPRDVVPLS